MKKIITMILTVVALLTVLPAFADIGAVAPISSVPMSIVAKAPDVTMVPAAATGNPSQTANCGTCHKPDRRQISHRGKIEHMEHNLTNKKPIIIAGAVHLHPD